MQINQNQSKSVIRPTYESLNIYNLTPIHTFNDIFFKRDDLYLPFGDVPLSGGKIRQMCCLLLKNYDKIKNDYNGLVATGTSVNSPQGIVVSRSALEFGFKSIIVFGATKEETLMKNNMVKWVLYSNAEIDYQCRIAYDSALNRRIRQIQAERNIDIYHVKFGINLEDNPDEIINSTAFQCQNIPEDIENLIIPTGSAITAGGILSGLKKYGIKVKRVIIVQIAGYNREKMLKKIFNTLGMDKPDYQYVSDTTYPYSKSLNIKLNEYEMLDPVYEAKAFEWMVKHINYKNQKTLFWLIGNSYEVRTISPQMLREWNS